MSNFNTPCGRIVQGSPVHQQLIDMETNKPEFNDDGTPKMGTFLALAFPKVLPNGQRNTEFDAFFAQLAQTAVAAWPALFPNGGPAYVEYTKPGQQGAATHPRFSWKYQDGDGVDNSGKSVADKPGFAGHHIVKFSSMYPVRWFNEGKFAPHEEIQTPADFVKRGYWVRLFGEMRGNNATGTQVPGVAIYPNLGSLVERAEEIKGGPDAQQAFGAAPVGWRPPASASPIPTPGAPAVPTPAVAVPVPTPAVAVPVVSAALAAQGITWAMLQGQGWTEDAARQQGYLT